MTQLDTTVIVKIVLIELTRRVICVAGVALYCCVVALCSFLLFPCGLWLGDNFLVVLHKNKFHLWQANRLLCQLVLLVMFDVQVLD